MNDLFPFYSIADFINRPEEKVEFEITTFEDMAEPEVADVHKHSFYEILWVDEGESRQIIDFKNYELGKGSLFFISPGQVHEFIEWQPLKGGTIMFTGDFFLINHQNKNKLFELSFLDNTYFNPALNLSDSSFIEIRNTIQYLINEKRREDSDKSILQSYLNILLLQIQRSIENELTTKYNTRYLVLFKEFQILVEKDFFTNATVIDYSDQLRITQRHLNRVVKEITGDSATQFIQNRKMLEAKRLLTFTDKSVGEVAASLNYFDSSFFTKIFKKVLGQSPTSYRTAMSEKYRRSAAYSKQ